MFENNDEDRYSLRNALNQGNCYKVFKKVDDNFLFIKQNIEKTRVIDFVHEKFFGANIDLCLTQNQINAFCSGKGLIILLYHFGKRLL